MKLIYRDKYKIVDKHMSDTQVGARKNRGIRDHLFIIYGIIQDVLSSKKKVPINIILSDYKQCYDSLNLPICIQDLYSAGINDDKLALLYDVNKTNLVAVRTSVGITERVKFHENILQGDVWGPLTAANHIDSVGRECLDRKIHTYVYRRQVKLPP